MVNVLHILMTSNRLLFAIFSICAVCRHVRSLIKQQKNLMKRVFDLFDVKRSSDKSIEHKNKSLKEHIAGGLI